MRYDTAGCTAAWLLLIMMPLAAQAGPGNAVEKVRQGIRQFHGGDYDAAGKSFADADVSLPENRRIAFNRGCVHAAQGEPDKAAERLEEAALSTDPELAIRCYYNLGNVKAAKARAVFGEKPEEADGARRQEGVQLLMQAVRHYRDCLDRDEKHADARHNMEVIRLWLKNVQALWRQRDRRKQRDEMDLMQFLAMLESRQRALRSACRVVAEEPDSPRSRQEVRAAQKDQEALAEEIEPLKEKIAEAFRPRQPPAGMPGAPGATAVQPQGADAEQAIQFLSEVADEAGKSMREAAGQLQKAKPAEAASSQAAAVERLNEIYTALAPLADLARKAHGVQEGLVGQSKTATETPDAPEDRRRQDADFADLAWNQRFVTGWADALPPKVDKELRQMEATPEPAAGGRPPGADPQAAAKAHEAMRQAAAKIHELAPQVSRLSEGAAGLLDKKNAADALTKQEEALKILREILDALPKQQQQQQEDQNQDQNQNRQQQQEDRQDPTESLLDKARQRQRDDRELEKRLRALIGRAQVEKDW